MNAPGPNAVALFMDGTSNSKPDSAGGVTPPGRALTSVAVLSEWIPDSLRPGPGERYIRGVATDQVSGWWQEVIRARNALGIVFGYGLTSRVHEIYRRLCKHYRDGDAIFLFGFSRGACTARVLAGFVDEVGLLLESRLDLVDEAWSLYVRSGDVEASDLRAFLRKVQNGKYVRPSADNGTQLPLYFLGVWDTVAMWHTVDGVLFDPSVRLARVPSNVSHLRQAFAIHEVRRIFPELPWTALHPSVPSPHSIKQVWFPGNHADVGGGYVADDALARHALAWMIGEAVAAGLPVHAPVSQAHLHPPAPLLVHDESHQYEPGLKGRVSRLLTPVLNVMRRPTISIRSGLSTRPPSQTVGPLGVSLDEGYVGWLLDGGTTTFETDLPDETREMMVRAEDAAVQLGLKQLYEQNTVEPPMWIRSTTAGMIRGCAQRLDALLTSPPNAEIEVNELADSLKFQVLLRGAAFWADVDRKIRDAVDVRALVADAPLGVLNLWWKRLEAFEKAVAQADGDLPAPLKGKPTVDALEQEVLKPVRHEAIEAITLRGSSRRVRLSAPLTVVPPQRP
jgi:hypothetical protein